MIPGQTLHRLAARLCSAKSLERVVEPAIADLQKEFADHAREKVGERRFFNLVTGYVAIWNLIALCAAESLTLSPHDRPGLARAFLWAFGTTVILTILLVVPPAAGLSESIKPEDIVLLIPQALPLTIPTGIALGIAIGVGGMVITRGAVAVLLLVALLGSAASFGTMNWLMPAANQRFRQNVFNEMGNAGTVMKGSNEMMLRELRREANALTNAGQSGEARYLMWKYHLRWALPSAAFVLVLFAITAALRRRLGAIAVAVITPVAYLVLLFLGETLVLRTDVPPYVGAWLASVTFTLGTAVLSSFRVRAFG